MHKDAHACGLHDSHCAVDLTLIPLIDTGSGDAKRNVSKEVTFLKLFEFDSQ